MGKGGKGWGREGGRGIVCHLFFACLFFFCFVLFFVFFFVVVIMRVLIRGVE